jgi:hypothetical protein
MSFLLPSARAWHGHEVVDLAVGRLALHCAEENPDEVVAGLDDETEARVLLNILVPNGSIYSSPFSPLFDLSSLPARPYLRIPHCSSGVSSIGR